MLNGSSSCIANSSTPNRMNANTLDAGRTAHACPRSEKAEYSAAGSSSAHIQKKRAAIDSSFENVKSERKVAAAAERIRTSPHRYQPRSQPTAPATSVQ
mmetsp:Transcript_31128/g.68353  ORF Transcript_31128/g.68353 Transcript_31128/m.68353 type:complete len:99 (-) Transcript_31128:611-907(-)